MSKIILAARRSKQSEYLAAQLNKQGRLAGVLWETGAQARRRKLKRYFKSSPLLWPLRLLDIAAITIFNMVVDKRMQTPQVPPSKIQEHTTSDINDLDAITWLQQQKPTALLVYGTAILSPPTITALGTKILNIHSGILPTYRNVHSDFWALMNRDYKNIGISIIHLDAGIDTGDIALMQTLTVQPNDSLIAIKRRLLDLTVELSLKACADLSQNQLPKLVQTKGAAQMYNTPTLLDILRFIIQRRGL